MTLFFLAFSAISILLAVAYIVIISKYINGWRALPAWELPLNFSPKTKVSVIVPARNEAANIITCLRSLTAQNFPPELFEVIVVDDHSTDETTKLTRDYSYKNSNIKLLRLADYVQSHETQSFKKKAIETAIVHASGELIVTTDADCEVPFDWLALLVSFFEESLPNKFGGYVFIAAPVNFHQEKSLFERFQSLDFMGMMGVTGAGIQLGLMNMCNGANLAYSKAAFKAVGGFTGIDHLASGDDILLMQKMAEHFPGRIGFLKNPKATVLTAAKPDLNSFLSQRLRWATKSANYEEKTVTLILAIVLFFCLAIIGSTVIGFLLGWHWLLLSLVLILVKSVADYFFLGEMSRYFGRQDLMQSYLPSQLFHIAYIASVGILGNLKKRYEWKGRKVK